MIKSELAKLIATQMQLTQKDAEAAVATVFDSIAGSLGAGRRVELRGFGSFDLKERSARTGRNPKSGESVAMEAKRVMFFRPGKALKERVAGESSAP
ncbi:MAG: integration host factor subunit beta [Magnetococcus sp. YQC-5]